MGFVDDANPNLKFSDPLADRLEKAANFRDAFVHAFDDLDAAAIYRAARVLPDDLRMFMARWPDRMAYDRSAKEYRAQPGSAPVFPLEISSRVRFACAHARSIRDDLVARGAI